MDILSVVEGGTLCFPLFLLAALLPMGFASAVGSGYSEEDFLFAKYLKCLQTAGYQTVKDVVCTIRKRRDPTYNPDLSGEDCDLSSTYKSLRDENICGQRYERDFSQQFRDNISYIVSERNQLCHKYGNVIDLESRVAILKTCIEDIYKEASRVLRVNFDNNRVTVTDDLENIRRAKIGDLEDWEQYLEDFKNSLRFRFLTDGKVELNDHYGNLKTLNPCTWIDENENAQRFDLERTFTPPKIWDNKYHGDLPMKKLITAKMRKEIIPNVLLIKGLAGSGKTSLCRYLVYSWYKKMAKIEALEKFDLVMLIEIRNSNSKTVLSYLTEELMRNTCSQFKSDDIIPLLKELDVLFIVDGYDERSDRGKELMEDIFENFSDKRVIVTTRLDYEGELEAIAKKHKMKMLPLTLQGFDDANQKTFSKKVFEVVNKKPDDFLDYLDGRGRVLDEHLKLPLTISLLIVLWMESPKIVNKITTATCLYYEIFNLFQEKLVERIIVNLKGQGARHLKCKILELLSFLGEQAWFLLCQGYGCEITDTLKSALERKCLNYNVNSGEFLSAFLMCEIDHSIPSTATVAKTYSFIHRTQMEYLAAEYLSENIKNGETILRKIDGQVSDWRRHSEVLVYLIGNMAKKNILKGKEEEMIHIAGKTGADSLHFSYWWKLLSESQISAEIPDSPNEPIRYGTIKHPKVAERIDKLHLSQTSNWWLDESNVAAGLRLMCLISPYQLIATSLVINISKDCDPDRIPDFYDALNSVKYHWEQKEKKPRVTLEMHLQDHDSVNRNQKSSDKFLRAIDEWAELTNFTGCFSRDTYVPALSNVRRLRCTITSPDILLSLDLPQSLSCLRLTLGFDPEICNPETLQEIEFNGSLELFVPNISNQHLNWLIKVVKKLSGLGLQKLHLEFSELTLDKIQQLGKSMRGILRQTLSVTPPARMNRREQEKLEDMFEANGVTLEWLE